jgi:PAS domain S-box-containing protein
LKSNSKGELTDAERLTLIKKDLDRYQNKILKNMEMVVLMLDTKGRVIFCNDYLAKITGWEKKEIIGADWFDRFIPGENHLREMFDEQVRKKKIFLHYENPILTKNDGERNILWSNIFFESRTGLVLGVISLGLDVTDQRKAEEALRQSERKYSTIVEGVNDGVVIIQDQKIKFANRKILDITGFSIEECLDRSFLDFVSPAYRAITLANYKKRMTGGKVVDRYEVTLRKKNGLEIPVEISGAVNEYGGRPAELAIIRDVSQRKEAEELLRQSESRYRFLFEAMSSGVLLFDENKRIVGTNPAAARILKLDFKAMEGRLFSELFPLIKAEDGNVLPEGGQPIDLASKTKKEFSTIIILPPNGENLPRWLKVEIFPRADPEGGPTGFYMIFDDISLAKLTQLELQKQYNAIKRINKLMIGREIKMAELKKKLREEKSASTRI